MVVRINDNENELCRGISLWLAIGNLEMVFSVIDVALLNLYWSPILCEELFYVMWNLSEF